MRFHPQLPRRTVLLAIVVVMVALCCAAPCLFAQGSAKAAAPPSILPDTFAGWERVGEPERGNDPHKLDANAGGVLKEDRFTDYEQATYKREDRTLTLRAARFADAEGAYAAFTFYRQPQMRTEDVGRLAVSLNDRVLFFSGNVLVDANFDHVTGMSGAQLRELASRLPKPTSAAGELPTLPSHLPGRGQVPESAHYVIGPAAYAALNLDLSPALIDFEKSPQVLWARYNGEAPGSAEVLLIAYPTPHIAIDKLPAYQQLAPPASGSFTAAKRTGPIVAVVRGNIGRSEGERLLNAINYDVNVTWNENSGQAKRDNIGNLVIAALTLAGFFFLISIGAGAVFGFGRAFWRRLRGKNGSQNSDDGEMIRLDLR